MFPFLIEELVSGVGRWVVKSLLLDNAGSLWERDATRAHDLGDNGATTGTGICTSAESQHLGTYFTQFAEGPA